MPDPPTVQPEDYPELFQEKVWSWGPIRTVFKLGFSPAEERVSNIRLVPYVGEQWLLIRDKHGWCITGGTLEPGETCLQAIERELKEEAGARLKSFTSIGAWHCHSLADKPFRPHLPWPEFYWVVGYGEVERVGPPENPEDGEQILEVATFPLETACRLLIETRDSGPELAATFRLAAALKSYHDQKDSI